MSMFGRCIVNFSLLNLAIIFCIVLYFKLLDMNLSALFEKYFSLLLDILEHHFSRSDNIKFVGDVEIWIAF